LADAPERQTIEPVTWAADGNILVAGLPGSGVTSTMRALVLALAGARPVESLHVYAITTDLDALRPLERLPHCGGVVATDDLERSVRLLRTLGGELRARRQGARADTSTVLTVVDGVAALRSELESAGLLDEIDLLERLAADGPAAGLVFAIGAEHLGAIGHRLERTAPQRLLLRLPERSDYLSVAANRGAPPADPQRMPPGRGYLADGTEVQVMHTRPEDVAERARHTPPAIGRARPRRIDVLPELVRPSDARVGARLDGDSLQLQLAIGNRDLAPVGLTLRPGDHVLVSGPARSGKSSALRLVATAAAAAAVRVVDLGTGGATARRPDVATLRDAVERLLASSGRTVVLVDDADGFDDAGALLPLVQPGRPDLHVVAAGRADRLRGMFRHWTTEVRRSRLGLLLRGEEIDGDLLGARIPRHVVAPWRPGRGWLVRDDDVELCQLALADEPAADTASRHAT
jgi:S-DNA-T family DNA segregation ATPase FtsK/SpoIIIE